MYKRLDRSYLVMREVILEEIEALDPDTRAELVASIRAKAFGLVKTAKRRCSSLD